jgi:hypothetical protein
MKRPAYTFEEVEAIIEQVQAVRVNGEPVFSDVVLRESMSGHSLGLETEDHRAVVPFHVKPAARESKV